MEDDLQCRMCGAVIAAARWDLNYRTCLDCGDLEAVEVRSSWCVLTPHKQGPMFFTPEFAREAAQGINNKGGLIK